MKKIIFLVLPEKGHINPYIGPAQALQKNGNRVSFASIGNISEQIEKAGLEFDLSLVSKKAPEQPMRGKELVDLVNNKIAMKKWIQSLLLNVSKEDVTRQLDWLKLVRPDVLVIDPLAYTSVIAAELSGIPWVSMSNSLNPVLEGDVTSDLLDTLQEIRIQRDKLFQTFDVKVDFKGCDALSKYLTIAFCTPEFVGERGSDVHMVGPSLPIKNRGDETVVIENNEELTIYASFGSQIFYWPEIFEKLMTATQGENWRLILSVGDLIEKLQKPDHVTLYRYAPQLEILPKSTLFITHGGANSVMESIYFQTKLWVTPMCNDQFHQGHYVNKSGIGLVEDIRKLSTIQIKERIKQILNSREIETNINRVARSYQIDGSRKSAELIEALI
tara:strand:- start:60073 stop:61233 length:1161 start_codon:yes stop_codon:yes gene_type:complete